jgi:hypothetical protein
VSQPRSASPSARPTWPPTSLPPDRSRPAGSRSASRPSPATVGHARPPNIASLDSEPDQLDAVGPGPPVAGRGDRDGSRSRCSLGQRHGEPRFADPAHCGRPHDGRPPEQGPRDRTRPPGATAVRSPDLATVHQVRVPPVRAGLEPAPRSSRRDGGPLTGDRRRARTRAARASRPLRETARAVGLAALRTPERVPRRCDGDRFVRPAARRRSVLE